MNLSSFAQLKWKPLAFLLLFGLFACNKASNIGNELLDTEPVNLTNDVGIEFKTHLKYGDDFLTYRGVAGIVRYPMGQVSDPQTGQLDADVYTQIFLQGSDVNFVPPGAVDSIFDGVRLKLGYTTTYGRPDQNLKLEVNEVTTAMDTVTKYTISTALPVDEQTNLAEGYLLNQPLGQDTGSVYITLSPEFGKRIFDASPTNLANNDAFTQFVKGLRFRATKENPLQSGALYALDLSACYVTLFYRYVTDTAGVRDTIAGSYNLIMTQSDGKTGRFYTLKRTKTENTLFSKLVDSVNVHSEADKYALTQATAFVEIEGQFNDLTALKNKGINIARLYVKVDPNFIDADNAFAPPPRLVLNQGAIEYASASYDATNQRYVFDARPLLQNMVLRPDVGNKFVLYSTPYIFNKYCGHRVVVGNHKHPLLYPELRVQYSELPE